MAARAKGSGQSNTGLAKVLAIDERCRSDPGAYEVKMRDRAGYS